MKGQDPKDLPTDVNANWTIGIVCSMWHRDILDKMIDVARDTFIRAGLKPENIHVYDAPGSFEVPLIGAAVIERHDALIGFGIVLQGETMHAQNIMQSTTQAIMDLQVAHKKPFAFEILHVLNIEQAHARAEGEHNKGFEAARAVLQALATLEKLS